MCVKRKSIKIPKSPQISHSAHSVHSVQRDVPSLRMVTDRTNKSGERYVKRNPTLKIGMNCEHVTARKYRLKKNLNCSKRTTGRNVITFERPSATARERDSRENEEYPDLNGISRRRR
jgi:hypothetical protein